MVYYDGYDGRTVIIQVREDVTASTYGPDQRVVTSGCGKVRSHLVLNAVDDATPDGRTSSFSARYSGNGNALAM